MFVWDYLIWPPRMDLETFTLLSHPVSQQVQDLSIDLIRIGKSSSQCALLLRSDFGDCSFWWLLWSALISPVSLKPFLGCGDPDPLSLSMVIPSITRRWTSDGLMLAQRRRRWTNIIPTQVQRVVFAVFNWDYYQELIRFLLQYNSVIMYSLFYVNNQIS